MRLRIEHTTAFDYDSPISEAYTEMRLRPLETDGQFCTFFHLRTEPEDEVFSYTDRFGNTIHHFDVLHSHNRLVVTSLSEVSTPSRFEPTSNELSLLLRYDYLQPTNYAPFTKELAALGRGDPSNPRYPQQLLEAVHKSLVYTKGATTVETTAPQALALGKGVCQDYTHILLSAVRANGIPARYVSGYVFSEGHTAATHAWADIYLPDQGWISLDPTHNREQNDHYVRLAVGRDYSDVPPTRGVYTGNAKEHMRVHVSMTVL